MPLNGAGLWSAMHRGWPLGWRVVRSQPTAYHARRSAPVFSLFFGELRLKSVLFGPGSIKFGGPRRTKLNLAPYPPYPALFSFIIELSRFSHHAETFDIRGKSSGLRIDSTERSTSSSGQYRWFSVGRSISESCSMVADLNHGNSENCTANSSSSSKSQKQCLDTLVTSAAKVAMPGIFNLLNMGFNDGLRLNNLHF